MEINIINKSKHELPSYKTRGSSGMDIKANIVGKKIELLEEDVWSLQGAMPLHELAELTGEDCDESGVTTVSGLITKRLGSFPKVGDILELGPYELRVEQTFRLQVEQARLTRLARDGIVDSENS